MLSQSVIIIFDQVYWKRVLSLYVIGCVVLVQCIIVCTVILCSYLLQCAVTVCCYIVLLQCVTTLCCYSMLSGVFAQTTNVLVREAAKLAVYMARTTITTSHQLRSTILPGRQVGQLSTGS